MGRDKSLLTLPDGGTFLQHAIDRLDSICDDVVISGKTNADHSCLVIEDPVANQGPAIGIAAVLKYAGERSFAGCFVTPVDTPFLSEDDVWHLRETWEACNKLTVARSDRTEPLIGIYPADLADELARLAASDNRSLYAWIESRTHQTVMLSASSCRNINTPTDLSHGS
jgi:molybdopterin-guanine dinucleotide biosynthesis protein A